MTGASFLAVLLALLAASLLAWQLQRSLGPAWQRYRDTYMQDAHHGLQEVFLFLDPKQLWGMAMSCACGVFGLVLAAGAIPRWPRRPDALPGACPPCCWHVCAGGGSSVCRRNCRPACSASRPP